jgi:TRAP-type C4-dicarboxylate transport system substrate-binding protein
VFREAAAEAALIERKTSVADIPNILAECEQNGVEVVRMNDQELVKFQAVVGEVYDMYADYFQAGLVESIQKA